MSRVSSSSWRQVDSIFAGAIVWADETMKVVDRCTTLSISTSAAANSWLTGGPYHAARVTGSRGSFRTVVEGQNFLRAVSERQTAAVGR